MSAGFEMRPRTSRTNAAFQRLPVNQRRHKVAPENRKRVQTACNSCNVRRIKCSGDKPCLQCRTGSRDCQYPVTVEKVSIPRNELSLLKAQCESLERCLSLVVPDEARRRDLIARVSSSTPPSLTSASPASPESSGIDGPDTEGRLLSDIDGTSRYLGSTSGATFLDLVKEFMRTMFPLAWPDAQDAESTFLGSLGRYQTFDSRPLPMHDVEFDPKWLPKKGEIILMTNRLRYFLQDGSGEFVSGGIYYWGDFDTDILNLMSLDLSSDRNALRRLAFLHAALAVACHLELPQANGNSTQFGEMYFTQARRLIGNPLDMTSSSICDIPVLAMMSVYLVEMNRRDAAYMHVSLGMHLAVMHGVHHGWVPDEQTKRSFWTLYVLDRWLACLQGRPPSLSDEAIRLPLPEDVAGLPSAAGLRAHVELSKICGYIVCNTYRIAPWENQRTTTTDRVETALAQLSKWLEDLPPELQLRDDRTPTDRACCELHMIYNQLLILTIRPIFFVAVKKGVARRFINRSWTVSDHPEHARIRKCSEAARRNLRLGRWIRDLSNSRKLLSTGLHFIFNAAIILLLDQLLFDHLDETDAMDIIFVIECFDIEAQGDSNYAKDCSRVLRDLSLLVQRIRHQEQPSQLQTPISAVTIPAQVHPPAATAAYDVGFILNPELPPGVLSSQSHPVISSSSLYLELSNWMQGDYFQLYNCYPI